MMPSPENMRVVIDTLRKRIEHKQTQATAIKKESAARCWIIEEQAPARHRDHYSPNPSPWDLQVDAITTEAKARCGLIELDIEQMKAEKAQAEKMLSLLSSTLVVPGR